MGRKILRDSHVDQLKSLTLQLTKNQLMQIKINAAIEGVSAPLWVENRISQFINNNDEQQNIQAAKPIGANRSAYSA